MRKVAVIAGGISKRWGVCAATQRNMISEAGKEAFDSCRNLTPKDVEGLLCSAAFTERVSFQTHLAPLAAEVLGIKCTKLVGRVEILCGSGNMAIQIASMHIACGYSDIIAVAGVEKCYMPEKWETFFNMQAALDREFDNIHGLGAPPPLFSFIAQKHMEKYGTTEEQMAMVAVKNRRNGVKSPYAQFQQEVTLDDCMNAKTIVAPLKLMDCCPVTDGAAVVILASEERAKELTDKPVYIMGFGQAGFANSSVNCPGYETWPALKQAAGDAYERAGVKPDDIDVAETHDCFTISEIIEYEEFGWCEKGEGGKFIEEGQSDFGGQVVVNPDGGLISCGHPFGATGVRQTVEIMRQLQGKAGDRQVKDAKIGLTHNLSGYIGENTIVIYGSDA